MKFITSLAILLSLSFGAHAHDENANAVVISKAVELGVHRIERLVTLKKIDPSFINHLYSLRAERNQDESKPYTIHGYVVPNANNQSSTVSMVTDAQGKVVSYTAGDVYEPANPVNWPEKDAATLIEDALHFILEGWSTYAEVKPFYLGLSSLTLTAEQNDGKLIAVAKATSDDDEKTLYIRLKTDGTFISHEIR